MIFPSLEPLEKSPLDNVVNAFILPQCPDKYLITVPVVKFHILILKSADPDARSPLDNVVNAIIPPVCPDKVLITVPAVESHTLIVPSPDSTYKFSIY
jgi:hypothetical protein